jgi:hypothetical protein
MSKYTFKCEHHSDAHYNSTTEVTLEADGLEDILTGVSDFLRGCGFILDYNTALALISSNDLIFSPEEAEEVLFSSKSEKDDDDEDSGLN